VRPGSRTKVWVSLALTHTPKHRVTDTNISGWQSETRPGGPHAKLQPSPEGLGINPEHDLSAVGAAPFGSVVTHTSKGRVK
jgi:hypothetical protein